jgi:hypothetical protein
MTSSEDCRVTSVSPTPKDTEAEEAIARALAEDVLDGWCPTCEQPRGKRCREFTGLGWQPRRDGPHIARQARAVAAVLAASPAVTEGERADSEAPGSKPSSRGRKAPSQDIGPGSALADQSTAASPAVTAAEDETEEEWDGVLSPPPRRVIARYRATRVDVDEDPHAALRRYLATVRDMGPDGVLTARLDAFEATLPPAPAVTAVPADPNSED